MKTNEDKIIKKKSKLPTFSLVLREEFLRRCKKNANYSLRGFAKHLKTDPSLLSKILRGQRKPSSDFIKQIGPAIGFKADELLQFVKGKVDVDYYKMNEDIFSIISDWFHFAILELIKTDEFNPDVRWIASRLNIHTVEAQAALERLERLNFIDIENGTINLKSENNTWANNEMTSLARKNLQKELAQKALSAIEDISFEHRESGSLTIACSKKLIPNIKNKIQKFRREIDDYIQENEKPDEVYQLVVSFYPLTKIKT